ncbi:aspartate/glutamate racemase family protein [Alteribacter populi]|uniref:aspartate/glutamate racemase family protein n=1 Tax=Alteribacter populi TaxID=2011011 RepID=UPI000BBAE9DD|nr:aspartate/glutamate racemase family protein [Alteribacter populi]
MKTIGFIGGLSWESTSEYYRYVNETVKEQLGNLHSAKCFMHSFDFQEMVDLQHESKWQEATDLMVHAAKTLETAGADVVVICTNTMHKMADVMETKMNIPLLHIADATAEKIIAAKQTKVAVLGTKFTMEDSFYHDRLKQHGIETIIPTEEERAVVHRVIYDELCKGVCKPESKAVYIDIIEKLHNRGAEGIVLGCTEIPLLIKAEDVNVSVYDTTKIHAEAAAVFALDDEKVTN